MIFTRGSTAAAWYWVIDVTAVLLTISSLTGMITFFSLRARRRSGFIVGADYVIRSFDKST